MGYSVTVFEALPGGRRHAGGRPAGVPPAARQSSRGRSTTSQQCGVEIEYNTPINVNLTVEDLRKEGYEAVFIAAGAQRSQRIGIPGELEDVEGFHYGLSFLRDVKLGGEVQVASGSPSSAAATSPLTRRAPRFAWAPKR